MKANKKLAMVTGAGRGLGQAVAISLAEHGYQVILIGRSEKNLQQTATVIADKAKQRTWIIASDVSQREPLFSQVQPIIADNGGIDILVNNAGVCISGYSDMPAEDFEQQLQVNLLGAFHCMQAVVETMKQQQFGYIINISSTSAKFAKPHRLGYAASKYGLMGMNEALFNELSGKGIKVTALCPRYMVTDMTKDLALADEKKIPLSDITNTIQYLLNLSVSACVKEIVIDCAEVVAQG